MKEIKIENVDDEIEREEHLEIMNEEGKLRLPTVAYSKILSKLPRVDPSRQNIKQGRELLAHRPE